MMVVHNIFSGIFYLSVFFFSFPDLHSNSDIWEFYVELVYLLFNSDIGMVLWFWSHLCCWCVIYTSLVNLEIMLINLRFQTYTLLLDFSIHLYTVGIVLKVYVLFTSDGLFVVLSLWTLLFYWSLFSRLSCRSIGRIYVLVILSCYMELCRTSIVLDSDRFVLSGLWTR